MNKTWYEEVKEDFVKNINDSYTLNLAISILEDRKELLEENQELMLINEGVHKAREKDTETINKLAMVLVDLREWLEEDKDKINVLDTKNNSSVKLGITIGLGMCLDKLNELEGGKK